MIPRVASVEDAKDLSQRPHLRVSPFKALKTLMVFLAIGVGFSLLSIYTSRRFTLQSVVTQARETFMYCVEEKASLEQWIKPPSSVTHSMTDEELFWRATFIPQVKKYPYRRVPRIAFMFLTRGPLPLAPLWEEFFRGNEKLFSVYVHALPEYVANYSSSSAFYKRQVPSQVWVDFLSF